MKEAGKRNTRGVSRREFMKKSAAGAGFATVLGAGFLPASPGGVPAEGGGGPQTSAPVIDPGQIKETLTADIVVAGLGISGLCAALTAVESGAKTIALEKGETNNARGFDDGCVNSSVHREAGVLYDREELIGELMRQANYRVDQRLITAWVDHSGEAIDWLRGLAEPRGVKASLGEAEEREGPYKVYRTAVNWTGQNAKLLAVVEQLIREKGGDLRFKTAAVQLIREKKGPVTGVIARQADGGLSRINAGKGVILCTGGYDNNPEMMRKYLRPSDLRIEKFNSRNTLCTGDGHSMGLAVGAALDEPPHCLITGNGIINNKVEFYLIMFTPWLRVDALGRRYVNEDSDYCRQANANSLLPRHFNWSVLDSRWAEGPESESQYMNYVKKQMENYISQGVVITAGTLEELAAKIQVEPEVFKATVARYNELAKNKKDLDFGVAGDKMKPVEKPPFLAMQVRNFALVTVSGLRINEHMQVLDTEGSVISGLYAAGNTSGGFFADTYPRNVHGISHGRAITFGRLAAKHAGARKV